MTDPFDLFLAELNRIGGPEPRDHVERGKLRQAFDRATEALRRGQEELLMDHLELKRVTDGLAGRVAAQSELLSARAEKPPEAPCPTK